MTDAAAPTDQRRLAAAHRTRRRRAAERRFRLAGLAAVWVSTGCLAFLLGTMLWQGLGGFRQTWIGLPVDLAAARLPVSAAQATGRAADLALAGAGLENAVDTAARQAYGADGDTLIADGAWLAVRDAVKADPTLLRHAAVIEVPASTMLDLAYRGAGSPTVDRLAAAGRIGSRFDLGFLTASDSTDPVRAGIWGALKGSLLTMLVTLALAFPIGLLSALYLEEYAPRNRFTDLIEVSINNLAAVPSIIFGLLGLAVFLGMLHLPRSAPLVGGLTLALMTMPVIVIAGRTAIRGVPPSIRDAALSVGASPVQVVFHHVLPLAMPGVLTGTIIGMARALGETAPLLMIGMRAFIAAPPGGLADPATVLPVQIFLWSDEVGRGFVEKTSAAIIVLLAFLLAMNAVAIHLRHRFETRL